jgi:hypothetical protein
MLETNIGNLGAELDVSRGKAGIDQRVLEGAAMATAADSPS